MYLGDNSTYPRCYKSTWSKIGSLKEGLVCYFSELKMLELTEVSYFNRNKLLQ